MKKNALNLLTALLLLSCQTDKAKEAISHSTTDQSNYKEPQLPALLKPKEQRREYIILPFGEKPDYVLKGATTTRLTEDDIDEVYRLVQGAVDEYNTGRVHLAKTSSTIDLRHYRLQLIPALDAKGEKIVWVNAFCSDVPAYWENSLVVAKDGGNCFFKVSVNLLWRKWSGLNTNGEA